MSTAAKPQQGSADPLSDMLAKLIAILAGVLVVLVALPLLIPVIVSRVAREGIATKTRFWVVWKWHWLLNVVGIAALVALLSAEAFLLARFVDSGQLEAVVSAEGWPATVAVAVWPWAVANLLAGVLLLPVLWSIGRRKIAQRVRTRQITDVILQEKIETARKRAADLTSARRIGVRVDPVTGRITGQTPGARSAPQAVDSGMQAFGLVNRPTVGSMAERFHDVRRVRDWVDPTGTHVVLPATPSAVRVLMIAESGSGKTVLLNGLVLCALEYGWPVVLIDAKGDPADAEALIGVARSYGRTAAIGGQWNLFSGTPDQITAKLMRLMPAPDGANQYYLDEIRGVLQAVQDPGPLTSTSDLQERLTNPAQYVRDQFDLSMVNQTVDRSGTTSAGRVLQSLLVALRPLERWISDDGWTYEKPPADVTVVPLSPVDGAQARLGDLLLLDLRNFLATRLERRDKSPMLVIVDEFPQLVTEAQDPGDTAGSLFETARTAGVGLILASQSPSGLSNDPVRRRRALTSGAALLFGRSKDPEEIVSYAGSVMRLESSGRASGEELGSARAQNTYVVPPQDVREASDGAFWLVQAGSLAAFRAFPTGARPGNGVAPTDEELAGPGSKIAEAPDPRADDLELSAGQGS